MKKNVLLFLTAICTGSALQAQQAPVYLNASQPLEARVTDLISRLTLEEKVNQMMYYSPAITRLNIPAYNWWNEGLHGVGRSGKATMFPQAIGLAATFDDDLALREATVISDEARAIYNASVAKDYHLKYAGLTFWTPNINIFRDPRWGRGQETYGEDPYLTSRMGVAFVKGLQGNDPKYLKVAACAKHYAVHSGPERLRHEFDAKASIKDLRETYLPAFKALVQEANVEAVMCAYNRTNTEPCCANKFLLQDVLRDEWKFKGHVVSDCWAIKDFYEGHKVVNNAAEAAAFSVKRGVSLNCGDEYPALIDAVKQGLITEKEIDKSLAILMRTKFRLGMFDAAGDNPYSKIPVSTINSPEHRALAKEVAIKSIVLLKNRNHVLPLKNDLRKYFVTGPNATNTDVLMGNYYGVSANMVTILEGLSAQIQPGSQMQYRPGCLLDRDNVNPIDWTTEEAKNTDANIVVLGISGLLEGEEGDAIASPSFGDRLDYNIPKNQIDFLKKMRQGNDKPIIVIITGGSPMNLKEVHDIADAVLLVWYPGEEGGSAVGEIVFGKASPSGKLPLTFPMSLDQLPPYEDYSMKGRTYRYMQGEPMYPFGFGLSYTSFNYSDLTLSKNQIGKKESVTATVTITNAGNKDADEVAELYVTNQKVGADVPLYALKGFKRLQLKAGEARQVTFALTPEMLALVDEKGISEVKAGTVKISIAGSLPCSRSEQLGASKAVTAQLTIK